MECPRVARYSKAFPATVENNMSKPRRFYTGIAKVMFFALNYLSLFRQDIKITVAQCNDVAVIKL